MQDKLPQTRRNPDFVMPNHKTTNCILEARNKSPFDFLVSKPTSQKKIRIKSFMLTRCELNTDAPVLTAYDLLIHDAVCTLCDAGNICFTTKTIWRVANGMSSNRDPHEDQINRVDESMDRLRNTRVIFDASDEVQARGLGRSSTIDGNLIDCRRGSLFDYDGVPHTGYVMLATPIMLEYSDETGQILRAPYGLMNVRKPDGAALHLTGQRMALKDILMRRILWEERSPFRIALEGIAEKLGKKPKDKKARQILRSDIEVTLAFWVKEGLIQGFKPYKRGRTIAGYEVRK